MHCSSHRLNLVVNDLNSVMDVRNTVGTIKSIIAFFRDSPKRRAMIPNVPLLSETLSTATDSHSICTKIMARCQRTCSVPRSICCSKTLKMGPEGIRNPSFALITVGADQCNRHKYMEAVTVRAV